MSTLVYMVKRTMMGVVSPTLEVNATRIEGITVVTECQLGSTLDK